MEQYPPKLQLLKWAIASCLAEPKSRVRIEYGIFVADAKMSHYRNVFVMKPRYSLCRRIHKPDKTKIIRTFE